MVPRRETRQVPLCEPEQTHRRRQTPAMLRVRWVLEPPLKVNKCAGRLDQPFEIVRIGRFGRKPKLFQDVMSFVVTLFVPAMEKRAIKRVVSHASLVPIDSVTGQLGHKPRNPLAFVHGGLNLFVAQRMSKPATISSSEGHPHPPPLPGEGEATPGARGP